MIIGIDMRCLEGGGAVYRGIGRYVRCLIEAISKIDHTNEYVFFLSSERAKLPKLSLDKKFSYRLAYNSSSKLRDVKYVRAAFVLSKPLDVDQYGLDVFLQPDPIQRIKRGKTPTVSVLHDLIPFIYKETYQQKKLKSYRPGHVVGYSRELLFWQQFAQAFADLARATRLISISEHTKRDFLGMHRSPTLANKIDVVPLASFEAGHVVHGHPSRKIKDLAADEFLFYVGGADPRKGLVDFVKSTDALWHEHPNLKLVLGGKEMLDPQVTEAGRLRDTITRLNKDKHIVLLGQVTDADLAHLYHHAVAFVFPSRYEGFGLPVLEAMQAGCPVVAYENSSIPEVTGNAALLVPDGEPMLPTIKTLLDNEKLRQELAKKGKAQAKKFSWDKTAKRTLAVLTEVTR